MDIVTVRYTYRGAFLSAYDPALPHGGLFIPSTRPLRPDEAVVVELAGRLLPERVLLRGIVVAVRPAVPWLRVRAALRVAFAPSERGAVDFVLGVVSGAIPARRRRLEPRLPVSLAARYRCAGDRVTFGAEVADISVGGLALLVKEPPPQGAHLVVQFPLPGGWAPVELEGPMVFTSAGGDRVGMRFARRGDGGVRRLREAIRRLRAG